jgi:hypothetical protein
MSETTGRYRVSRTSGALYGYPRRAQRRRRCDGHLADRHWIEVGDLYVSSALPPDTDDIGNPNWWHANYCLYCAPAPDSSRAALDRTGKA